MTEKRNLKWALELAIEKLIHHAEGCDYHGDEEQAKKYSQAASMLRDGTEKADKKCDTFVDICRDCGRVETDEIEKGFCDKCGDYKCDYTPVIKTWTEHTKLKPVLFKSEPVFVKVVKR